MSYSLHLASSRRLALLRLLVESGGSANESIVRSGLMALGFAGLLATVDAVRADLTFLAERGLVQQSWYLDKVLVATITKRGVAYTRREVEPIEGIEYPDIGV